MERTGLVLLTDRCRVDIKFFWLQWTGVGFVQTAQCCVALTRLHLTFTDS